MPHPTRKTPHILFAGGGSMEHLHPGIAVAECLATRLPEARMTFFGDGRPIERYTVRAAGHQYVALPASPSPSGPLSALRYATDNLAGYCAARWQINEFGANLVVGLGGHASNLAVRAAQSLRIPTLLLEQDAQPTRLTKQLAVRAQAVCVASEESAARFPSVALPRVTGTPIRASRHANPPVNNSLGGEKCLTVLGGIGGARSLNETMPGVLSRLGHPRQGWRVVHQAGEGQLIETEHRYRRLGVEALVVTYIDDVAHLLAETNLAICRPGGSSLAELASTATPALLVPDSRSVYGSQVANGQRFEQTGVAEVIQECGGDLAERLLDALKRWLPDETALVQRCQAMARLARPGAANHVADLCSDLLGGPLQGRAPRRRAVAA